MRSEPPPGAPAPGELDELLRPTVKQREEPSGSKRPWQLSSQFYVAFFGGAVGATIIALLNATRLGLPAQKRWMIAAIGVAGIIATALVIAGVGLDDDGTTGTIRILGRVVGVVAWGGMYLIQRSADRVYAYRSSADEPYAPMWGPGIAAALVGAAAQLGLAGVLLGEVG